MAAGAAGPIFDPTYFTAPTAPWETNIFQSTGMGPIPMGPIGSTSTPTNLGRIASTLPPSYVNPQGGLFGGRPIPGVADLVSREITNPGLSLSSQAARQAAGGAAAGGGGGVASLADDAARAAAGSTGLLGRLPAWARTGGRALGGIGGALTVGPLVGGLVGRLANAIPGLEGDSASLLANVAGFGTAGALAGAPFAGVGAVPGAVVGGITGLGKWALENAFDMPWEADDDDSGGPTEPTSIPPAAASLADNPTPIFERVLSSIGADETFIQRAQDQLTLSLELNDIDPADDSSEAAATRALLGQQVLQSAITQFEIEQQRAYEESQIAATQMWMEDALAEQSAQAIQYAGQYADVARGAASNIQNPALRAAVEAQAAAYQADAAANIQNQISTLSQIPAAQLNAIQTAYASQIETLNAQVQAGALGSGYFIAPLPDQPLPSAGQIVTDPTTGQTVWQAAPGTYDAAPVAPSPSPYTTDTITSPTPGSALMPAAPSPSGGVPGITPDSDTYASVAAAEQLAAAAPPSPTSPPMSETAPWNVAPGIPSPPASEQIQSGTPGPPTITTPEGTFVYVNGQWMPWSQALATLGPYSLNSVTSTIPGMTLPPPPSPMPPTVLPAPPGPLPVPTGTVPYPEPGPVSPTALPSIPAPPGPPTGTVPQYRR